MKLRAFSITFLVFFLLLSGCSGPRKFKKNEGFVPRQWSKIAVLPFSGSPHVRLPAAEWLSFRLLDQQHFNITPAALATIELKKKGMTWPQEDVSVQAAQEAGQLLEAQGVIVGTAKIWRTSLTVNYQLDIKLIDTRTGEIVCNTVQPTPFTMTYSDLDRIIACVDRAAKDVLPVLDGLAGKNQHAP